MSLTRLSNRSRYAILAAVELATAESGQLITISQIAARRGIPARFLESILRQLKRVGIAESVRGNSGGYFLKRPANEVCIGEIVKAFESSGDPQDNGVDHSICDKLIESLHQKARDSFYRELSSVYLSDFVREQATAEGTITFVI